MIDHHRSNTRYGTFDLIDDSAEATTAVLARLFDLWGVEIDADLAHCLYAGLVTDTGSFRWVRRAPTNSPSACSRPGSTGPASRVACSTPTRSVGCRCWGAVLSSAVLVPDAADGRGLVHAVIRCTDSAGLGSEEVESVIDIVRTTAEAEVAAVFKESTPDRVGVAAVEGHRGRVGGSRASRRWRHRFAAGYTATGAVESAITALRETLG